MQSQTHLGKRKTVSGVALFPGVKKNSLMNRPMSASARALIAAPMRKFSRPNFEGVRNGVVISGTGGPERKNLNVSSTGNAVDNGTPYIASLMSTLAEGTSLTTRVGGKVTVKSIDIEGNYTGVLGASTTIASTPAYCDVFLVWDKQPDAAVPGVSTVLTSTNTNLTFGNIGQTERFVILRRESFVSSFNGDNAAVWKWHVALNADTKFPDATGSPNTNDYYVVAVSTNAAAGAAVIANSISYTARIKFTDA